MTPTDCECLTRLHAAVDDVERAMRWGNLLEVLAALKRLASAATEVAQQQEVQ